MFRKTDNLRNRRQPRHDEMREMRLEDRMDREKARDIARLYRSRIWL